MVGLPSTRDVQRRVRGGVERVAASPAGSWYIINVSSKLDPWILKRTDGRLSAMPGVPVLLLQHTGAKSGKVRETPLVYFDDGDDIVLIASKGGAPEHPMWYGNLLANPECSLIVKGRSGRYYAREATGARRTRLWAKALEVYGGYEVYQRRAGGRRVPVMVLSPVSAGSP